MASLRPLCALARLAKPRPTLDFRPSTFRHATVAGHSANIQLRQSLLPNRQFFVGFGIAALFGAGAWICHPISVKSTPSVSMQDERLDNTAQRFTDELLKLGCDANLESDYAIEHRIIPHPTRTCNLEIRLQVSRVRDRSVEAGRGNEVGCVFSSCGDVLNQEELSRVVGLEFEYQG